MNYRLSFLDDDGRVRDAWEAVFETDSTAKSWMRIAGKAWARDDEWALMELWGQERCVARAPAGFFRQASQSKWHFGQDP